MVILFKNCKKGYNKHFPNQHVMKTHTFSVLNNILNLGVFQKNYAAGGSMNNRAANGMGEVVTLS